MKAFDFPELIGIGSMDALPYARRFPYACVAGAEIRYWENEEPASLQLDAQQQDKEITHIGLRLLSNVSSYSETA